MVLHLAISLISFSVIHLVDFLDPRINFCFLHLNLIFKLMVVGLLLLLHPLFGMHFHSNSDLVIPFLLLNLRLSLGFLKLVLMLLYRLNNYVFIGWWCNFVVVSLFAGIFLMLFLSSKALLDHWELALYKYYILLLLLLLFCIAFLQMTIVKIK